MRAGAGASRSRTSRTSGWPETTGLACTRLKRYSSAVEDAEQTVRGFPTELRDDVNAVADVLPQPKHVMTAHAERVSVQGEAVEIPYRIYNPEPPAGAVKSLSELQRLIVACICSRHHDGYVRESACAAIVPSREPWVVPYVVRPLGEYVVEISTLILERLTAQSSFTWPAYREFVRANSAFMALTEQRAISYWSCYYRHDLARDEYPATVALNRLRKGDCA